MNINLHIERLVLDGLPLNRQQGLLLQTAVEAELTRLLTEQGLAGLSGGSAMPVMKTNSIHIGNQPTPAQLGAQIAQSVYGGINNE